MTVQLEYHLNFPRFEANFNVTTTDTFTFSIGNIRSRLPSVIYFKTYFEDLYKETIHTYTSPRWVVGNPIDKDGTELFDFYKQTFEVPQDIVDDTTFIRMEMVALGIDSENPLYFNRLMFQEGEYTEYHSPSEVVDEYNVAFPNMNYANFYDADGNYLQIIRPNRQPITTKLLKRDDYTILAPHFEDELRIDDDVSVFLEVMNQTEQSIDVLR